jgi:hypothetical protein
MDSQTFFDIMPVIIRHEDITEGVKHLIIVTNPRKICRGMQVPIPVSEEEIQKGNTIGWAMVTGYN